MLYSQGYEKFNLSMKFRERLDVDPYFLIAER